jgi:hypothetical protein
MASSDTAMLLAEAAAAYSKECAEPLGSSN